MDPFMTDFARPVSLYRRRDSRAAIPVRSNLSEMRSTPPAGTPSFACQQTEGEKLTYRMKGDNEGWTYEVQANGIVNRNPGGHFVEVDTGDGWTDFKSNAGHVALARQSEFPSGALT